MKTRRIQLNDAGYFVLRTPLLPYHTFFAGQGSAPVSGVLDTFTEREIELLRRSDIALALLAAAPSLWEQYQKVLASRDGCSPKIVRALRRYLMRLSSRPVPYGMCAGVTSGVIGANTSLKLCESGGGRVALRIEAEICHKAIKDVSEALLEVGALSVRLNPSTVTRNGKLYWWSDSSGKTELLSTKSNGLLYALVGQAKQTRSISDLCMHAANVWTASDAEQLRETAAHSWRCGLLAQVVPDALDEERALLSLVEQLRCVSPHHPVAQRVSTLLDGAIGEFRSAPAMPWHTATGLSAALEHSRGAAPSAYADFYRNGDVEFAKDDVAAITEAVNALYRISVPWRDPAFSEFRRRFERRYEGEPAPLLDTLDSHSGLGFPETQGAPEAASAHAAREQRDAHLLQLLLAWAAGGYPRHVELLSTSVEELDTYQKEPLSPEVTAQIVVARGAEGVNQLLLKSVVTGLGRRLLERFGNLLPCNAVPDSSSLSGDTIVADVAWLPRSRGGNVLRRRAPRTGYEISVGDFVPDESRHIALADLYLQSVSGRMVLWSRKHRCEVRPRVASAFNFRRPCHPVFRLLACIEAASFSESFKFSWGSFASAARLPRVQFGRVTLVPATWRLPLRKEASELERQCEHGRRALGLPRYVVYTERDAELRFDLDDQRCVSALAQLARGREDVVLSEDSAVEGGLLVSGPEGAYTHDIILPLSTDSRRIRADAPTLASGTMRLPRGKRYPTHPAMGSRWLYLNIFCRPESTGAILRSAAALVIDPCRRADVLSRWFFLRLSDPEYHLRLRFLKRDGAPWLPLASRFLRRLLSLSSARVIDSYEIVQYRPEYARYGGVDGVNLAEQVFSADSDSALEVLRIKPQLTSDALDAYLTSGVVDALGCLLPSFDDRLNVLHRWVESTTHAQSSGHAMNARVRVCRSHLAIIASHADTRGRQEKVEYSTIRDTLRARRTSLLDLKAEFAEHRKHMGVQGYDAFVISLLHMFVNRMSLLNGREREHAVARMSLQWLRGLRARKSTHANA